MQFSDIRTGMRLRVPDTGETATVIDVQHVDTDDAIACFTVSYQCGKRADGKPDFDVALMYPADAGMFTQTEATG